MFHTHRRPSRTLVTMSPALLADVRARFEANCRRSGTHLLWTGDLHRGAWPRISVDRRTWSAAAVAWVMSGRLYILGSRLWRRPGCPANCIEPRHRSVEAPRWSPRRRAAEQRRKSSATRRSAPNAASETSMPWAAKGTE